MQIFKVDAFTDSLFTGNPAAVLPVDEWLSAETMQLIAMENNLSETAFILNNGDGLFDIRWFTPETEVDLCGHASLAAAHVIMTHINKNENTVIFNSKSGELRVEKSGSTYWLDFPSQPPKPVSMPKLLPEAIGTIPIYAGFNVDLMVLVENEQIIQNMTPNFDMIRNLDVRGVIVTAASASESVDFVSRYFAPAVGVPEDPVTGSAHTVLTPFWSKKLGKKRLEARQISKRGGSLACINEGNRVKIGGSAVTFLTGTIHA
ncbi:PhzF family phenazine biosynthesis protein [Rhodohalobacter sp. 8-1]|uniref:PhzF family phenazine biosynthesis protein n=1 Tax=Rhodohalobacter sp. 8-1 TaxID=3131972 RepID=UPI0030ED5E9B